jgi:hypothetical protein
LLRTRSENDETVGVGEPGKGFEDAIDLLVLLEPTGRENDLPVSLLVEWQGVEDGIDVDAVWRDLRSEVTPEVASEQCRLGLGNANQRSSSADDGTTEEAVWDVKGFSHRRMTGAVVVRREHERDPGATSREEPLERERRVVRMGVDQREPTRISEEPPDEGRRDEEDFVVREGREAVDQDAV